MSRKPFALTTRRHAFTLIELIVVISIIAVLMALMLPAVQKVREAANSLACGSNLRQIGVAIGVYETTHRSYPTGGGDANWGGLPVPRTLTRYTPMMRLEQDWGWMYQILPFVDQDNLWRLRVGGPPNGPDLAGDQQLAATTVALYFCPSRRRPQAVDNALGPTPAFGLRAANDYAGNLGIWSMLFPDGSHDEPCLNYPGQFRMGMFVKGRNQLANGTFQTIDNVLRPADVPDGLSYTVMVGEKRYNSAFLGQVQAGDNTGFVSGYGSSTLRTGFLSPLRDASSVNDVVTDQFGAAHPHAMNTLFADGSVRPIRYDLPASTQILPIWIPPLAMRGIFPLPSPPNPPNSYPATLFQRLCHRADGGTINALDME